MVHLLPIHFLLASRFLHSSSISPADADRLFPFCTAVAARRPVEKVVRNLRAAQIDMWAMEGKGRILRWMAQMNGNE
jgi:hypothetical protein